MNTAFEAVIGVPLRGASNRGDNQQVRLNWMSYGVLRTSPVL